MDDVVIIHDTPLNNKFTMVCVGALIFWGASIAFRKSLFPHPIEERDRNKRYLVNSQTKLNKSIQHLNRNNLKIPDLPGFFGRHKRFNKSR